MNSTTINIEDQKRLLDLLLLAYDAGMCRALGIDAAPPASPHVATLLAAVERRWNEESAALHGWMAGDEPPLTAEEIPDWLRLQQRKGGGS